jgi:hypothetical protein
MAKPPVDDSDLEDLLSHQQEGTATTTTAPLNLDHLTRGQLDVSPRKASDNRRSGGFLASVLSYFSAWFSYMCYAYPRLCSCLTIGCVCVGMFLFVNAVFNPTETFGVIPHDWTNIQSQYDLDLGKIDHWCLKGDNDSCRCEDPLEPTSRGEFKMWVQAHRENKLAVQAYVEQDAIVDVAFVGESLVEEMDGRWMGRTPGEDLKAIRKIFKQHFQTDKTGMEGVALGIAGDTVCSRWS